MRKRLKQELATVSLEWDNEWQSVAGPEAIQISTVSNPQLLGIQGHTLADIAKSRGTDPMDTLFDILVEDNAQTEVAVFAMSEPDIALAAVQPWVSFCNDSSGTSPEGLLGKEFPHPRAYGTFPRVLRKYVREERRMRLEEAIRKFTSLPASRLRLNDRGVIKAGMWADIVVFDPQLITDRATFSAPNQLSEGMRWVLVNGVPSSSTALQPKRCRAGYCAGPDSRRAQPRQRTDGPKKNDCEDLRCIRVAAFAEQSCMRLPERSDPSASAIARAVARPMDWPSSQAPRLAHRSSRLSPAMKVSETSNQRRAFTGSFAAVVVRRSSAGDRVLLRRFGCAWARSIPTEDKTAIAHFLCRPGGVV